MSVIALQKHPLGVVGFLVVAAVILGAVFAPLIAPYDPVKDADLRMSLEPPSRRFLLGTDRQGRDILSRIIFGSRLSLLIGFVSQGMNTVIGVTLGLLAGLLGGKVDDLIMGATNVMLSIPSLIIALVVVAVLGPGLFNIFIALGFTLWCFTCRLTRAQVLSIKERSFVEAARALGASQAWIVRKHILPHILNPVIVVATFGVAAAILIEASLSFLGLGAQPPAPSWGAMITDGRDYIWTAPWIMTFPGIALSITIIGLNLLGDGLQDILDPRLRRAP